MQDMNNPLPATKDTHISLLAGPHSQGGSFRVKPNVNGWRDINLSISFTWSYVPVMSFGQRYSTKGCYSQDLSLIKYHFYDSDTAASGTNEPIAYIAVGR